MVVFDTFLFFPQWFVFAFEYGSCEKWWLCDRHHITLSLLWHFNQLGPKKDIGSAGKVSPAGSAGMLLVLSHRGMWGWCNTLLNVPCLEDLCLLFVSWRLRLDSECCGIKNGHSGSHHRPGRWNTISAFPTQKKHCAVRATLLPVPSCNSSWRTTAQVSTFKPGLAEVYLESIIQMAWFGCWILSPPQPYSLKSSSRQRKSPSRKRKPKKPLKRWMKRLEV